MYAGFTTDRDGSNWRLSESDAPSHRLRIINGGSVMKREIEAGSCCRRCAKMKKPVKLDDDHYRHRMLTALSVLLQSLRCAAVIVEWKKFQLSYCMLTREPFLMIGTWI